MSLFSIIAFDAPNSAEKRAQYSTPHVEALRELKNEGRLFAAGPLQDIPGDGNKFIGSILIIDFKNQAEAEEWFSNEPFCKAGVYEDITIKPYIDAMDFIDSYKP